MTAEANDYLTQNVGQIAATVAGATALFRRHKIDFCCGGNVPLASAAAGRGIDALSLSQELAALGGHDTDLPSQTPELIRHIVTRFHDTHRRELPELIKLARRVEAVHKDRPEVPAGLADLLAETEASLTSHLAKEENFLFPFMQTGLVPNGPIAVMRGEHNDEARHIRALQEVTHGFAPPPDACNTWRALYTGVEKFATDLTEHIHIENNILFPRFEKP